MLPVGGLATGGGCDEKRGALHEDLVVWKSVGSPTGPGMQAPSPSLFCTDPVTDDLRVRVCASVCVW